MPLIVILKYDTGDTGETDACFYGRFIHLLRWHPGGKGTHDLKILKPDFIFTKRYFFFIILTMCNVHVYVHCSQHTKKHNYFFYMICK